MSALSSATVYALARQAGFSAATAPMMVAIAMAESGLDPAAVGDVGLEDATWGPSVGLWQIRSLKAESGRGTPRDATQLGDPAANARAAYSIAGGGRNLRPWSTYTNGTAQRQLSTVAAGLRGASASGAPGTFEATGWRDLLKVPGGIIRGQLGDPLGGAGDVVGGLAGGLGGALDTVTGIPSAITGGVNAVVGGAGRIAVTTLFLGAAAALVVLGLYRGVQPAVSKVRAQVDDTAGKAAGAAATAAVVA